MKKIVCSASLLVFVFALILGTTAVMAQTGAAKKAPTSQVTKPAPTTPSTQTATPGAEKKIAVTDTSAHKSMVKKAKSAAKDTTAAGTKKPTHKTHKTKKAETPAAPAAGTK